MIRVTIYAVVVFSLQFGCTTSTKDQTPSPLPRNPSSNVGGEQRTVDLLTIQLKIPAFQKLNSVFTSPEPKSVSPLLETMKTHPEFSNIQSEYIQETYKAVGVDDPFQWMQRNPELYGAINQYIDPQNEGEPIWATTNRKLRKSESLSPDEEKFVESMNSALRHLPRMKGIFFRGARLDPKDLVRYKETQSVVEQAFTSSSIDPQIALIFTRQNTTPDRVSVIFIIRGHSGSPISAFHPGNNHELEVLFKPGLSFLVNRTLWSKDRKSVYIFLTEE